MPPTRRLGQCTSSVEHRTQKPHRGRAFVDRHLLLVVHLEVCVVQLCRPVGLRVPFVLALLLEVLLLRPLHSAIAASATGGFFRIVSSVSAVCSCNDEADEQAEASTHFPSHRRCVPLALRAAPMSVPDASVTQQRSMQTNDANLCQALRRRCQGSARVQTFPLPIHKASASEPPIRIMAVIMSVLQPTRTPTLAAGCPRSLRLVVRAEAQQSQGPLQRAREAVR